ncbi:single-stranded DNA-binding protein [Glaciibacter psychrotolerans]|uniref:Single-stranded DNA-binding protein n=1 Tax=Glaciibacter psychrotolerans TaxID=670054 RepID=A0A7Z0J646_9MICO|nr:single-stranded DNA-binding protein [Leifsonia psychrotolerans]NYJ19538.1 single-stranded DNA-binding protein [Leifsonia psychrotolerans]
MAIRTQESLSGFIASNPQLSFTSKGDAKFYARVGREHYIRHDDGSFTQDETSFHDLVMYRRSAERAYEQFAKADSFIAEGYIHAYSYEKDGQTVAGEEFVAKRLGHDVARTIYTVDRSRRQATGVEPAPSVERAAEQSVFPPIEPASPAATPPVTAPSL